MRIAIQGQSSEPVTTSSSITNTSDINQITKLVTQQAKESATIAGEEQIPKEKLQQAVDAVNELLQINHTDSKFVFHEGLDRYFVQIVDNQTEEVVKEIPPKKLLDAFYEMQKLLGMIVDEKI